METLIDFAAARWWVPRDQCGYFPVWLVVLHLVANIGIWWSYFRIPRTINKLKREGHVLFDEGNSRKFALFVEFCGWGHIFGNVLVFVWPHYIAFGVWDLLTAVVSLQASYSFNDLAKVILSQGEKKKIEKELERIHALDWFEHTQGDLEELRKRAEQAKEEFIEFKQNIEEILK